MPQQVLVIRYAALPDTGLTVTRHRKLSVQWLNRGAEQGAEHQIEREESWDMYHPDIVKLFLTY
jgi:hypothetical protein